MVVFDLCNQNQELKMHPFKVLTVHVVLIDLYGTGILTSIFNPFNNYQKQNPAIMKMYEKNCKI